MRIQPIDSIRSDIGKPAQPAVLKSRLKRLFDRPFNGVLKNSSSERPAAGGGGAGGGDVAEFEPSSVCLDKMVQNFIEDGERQSSAATRYGRNRCNCFNANSNDSSDDELDFFSDSVLSSANSSSINDPLDTLKSLVPCASVVERNLLADTSQIVEKCSNKRKDEELRKIVATGLSNLGYNASVCKSKWEKSSSIPAGEYEYIDVVLDNGERILIDVDFRSEFEIARSTSTYRSILQSLPHIFVGKSDRLLQIVAVASEAARQSLKKKGMHIAPWRKSEYMKSKWLSPHTRITPPAKQSQNDAVAVTRPGPESGSAPKPEPEVLECEFGELDLIFGESMSMSTSEEDETKSPAPVMTWQLPAVRVKGGNKVVVTGLASLLKEKL